MCYQSYVHNSYQVTQLIESIMLFRHSITASNNYRYLIKYLRKNLRPEGSDCEAKSNIKASIIPELHYVCHYLHIMKLENVYKKHTDTDFCSCKYCCDKVFFRAISRLGIKD